MHATGRDCSTSTAAFAKWTKCDIMFAHRRIFVVHFPATHFPICIMGAVSYNWQLLCQRITILDCLSNQVYIWLTLDSKGNYNATSNNTKLVHWPLMGGLSHLEQRGGAWAGCGPVQSPPRCTKCNSPPINGQCTNHCIAFGAYDGSTSMLCDFNVAIKGLNVN